MQDEPRPPSREAMEGLVRLYRQGRLADVVAQGAMLTEHHPHDATLHNIIGAAHIGLRQYEQAILCFWRAIGAEPERGDIYSNLGLALRQLGRTTEAIASFDRALMYRPDDAIAYSNRGGALRDAGRGEEALASFRRAAALRPDIAETHYNLANMYAELGQRDTAIAGYEKALAVHPAYDAARAQKLYQLAHICAWDAMAADADLVPHLGLTGQSLSPFTLLAIEDHPERHRQRAEKYVADIFGPARRRAHGRPKTRPERLRIGYFSADFHDHATMHLIAGLLEQHDRSRFEVHAYSYGPERDDPMRHRLLDAVEHFHDVRLLGDREIADRASADGIDIAIDLKGLTQDSRLGIFAHGAAPVQISYLGYPAPLAAPFIDYVIADHVVIPDEQRRHYPEKLIFLPDSYFPTDDRRPLPATPISRAEAGLPEQGLVFGCFNSSQKITPAAFDIWMRLLSNVEGSILWLLDGLPPARAHLAREAARRGIAAERLIFAPPLPQAEHIARLGLADLFLDCFHYNGHTTTADALWAGVPVLTRAGQGFPARVAASLLGAIGLPELITTSDAAYEALALALAASPQRRARLRRKLSRHRRSQPLFQTQTYTRHIERAYDAAHARYRSGGAPEDIDLVVPRPFARKSASKAER